MRRLLCLAVMLSALAASACTVQVHSDYPRYLANNPGGTLLPRVADSVSYYLDPATENHSQDISSFLAGAANTWNVQFGRILDATMNSEQIKEAFRSVRKSASREGVDGLLLAFSLANYRFEDFEARIAMKISAYMDGQEKLSKTYRSVGQSQGGKVFWGGAFAMKNAVQQSTKLALDNILQSFVPDLKKALTGEA